MDDLEKHVSSYRQDQEILDARGINMTVEEVAGLSTVKYSEKVQSLQLGEDDLAFLKGLRRRIKNRLASQNSRRRSLEHLRRLTRELRAARARRDAALAERRALTRQRDTARDRCRLLRTYVHKVLQERSDPSPLPDTETESHISSKDPTRASQDPTGLADSYREDTFECRIEKLVQKSVNHIYDKKVVAKTVFLDESGYEDCKVLREENGGVLNLCVKERRSHGRKQPAPRRIAYVAEYDDMVLDLKIKKENQ